jgi:formiminoglutamase
VLDAYTIRKQFYQLKKTKVSYKIADIGCLRPGPTYQDTILRYKEVFQTLIRLGIVPIVINGPQDLVLHSYASLADDADLKRVNIGVIDRKLDVERSPHHDEEFVNEILLHTNNRLHRLKLLAYQSYLTNPDTKIVFDKLHFEEIRLGAIKKDVMMAEPLLRNCHIVSLDWSALKHQEFPANATFSPFGLTAEEACQLTWFAGVSDHLMSFVFSGFYENEDQNEFSANGAAVALWYLIEGICCRVKEDLTREVTEYIVENSQLSEPITFVKGKKSDKWWIKIKDEFIPCHVKDYQQTQEGVLPDVWLREELS